MRGCNRATLSIFLAVQRTGMRRIFKMASPCCDMTESLMEPEFCMSIEYDKISESG
jgi:hypothetical protein